jgi:hypothetical protein
MQGSLDAWFKEFWDMPREERIADRDRRQKVIDDVRATLSRGPDGWFFVDRKLG